MLHIYPLHAINVCINKEVYVKIKKKADKLVILKMKREGQSGDYSV